MTMFVMTMTLVTTVIVKLIKLAGSFKNILSTMITRDRTKDFVILQSFGKSVGQTEYLVRKGAQLYYECDEINLHMGSMFSSSESELQFFQTYLQRYHQKDFTN